MFERTRCTRPYAPTRLQAINWRGISVAIVDENYGLPENAMDDAETKTKRNRVATDQSAAFLCKVGAAGDWNGRGSIESIRPGDRLSRSSRKLSAIAPLSTLPAIPSTRFLFSPLPRAIFPPRSHMLIVIPCFISRLPSSADYISRIYIFGYRGF